MLEIRIRVDKIDYNALLDVLIPLMEKYTESNSNQMSDKVNGFGASTAKAAISVLPDSVKEDLFVAAINQYSKTLSEEIETMLSNSGIDSSIGKVELRKIKEK